MYKQAGENTQQDATNSSNKWVTEETRELWVM